MVGDHSVVSRAVLVSLPTVKLEASQTEAQREKTQLGFLGILDVRGCVKKGGVP